MNYESSGFKIKKTDILKASQNALTLIESTRSELFDKECHLQTKRLFFKDRTEAQVNKYVIENTKPNDPWKTFGAPTKKWAKQMLCAINLVDDEHVWLTASDSIMVNTWISIDKNNPINLHFIKKKLFDDLHLIQKGHA